MREHQDEGREEDFDSLCEPFAVAAALGKPFDAPSGSKVYRVIIEQNTGGTSLDIIAASRRTAQEAVIIHVNNHYRQYYHPHYHPACPVCGSTDTWFPALMEKTIAIESPEAAYLYPIPRDYASEGTLVTAECRNPHLPGENQESTWSWDPSDRDADRLDYRTAAELVRVRSGTYLTISEHTIV